MKHPLHKLGKKNRNIVTGILVVLAALFLLAYYLNLPAGLLLGYLLSTLLFVLGIAILAIVAVSIVKLLQRLLTRDKP